MRSSIFNSVLYIIVSMGFIGLPVMLTTAGVLWPKHSTQDIDMVELEREIVAEIRTGNRRHWVQAQVLKQIAEHNRRHTGARIVPRFPLPKSEVDRLWTPLKRHYNILPGTE